jgi:hypothetical protein
MFTIVYGINLKEDSIYIDFETIYTYSFYWLNQTNKDRGFDSTFTLGLF